jgi:O-acetyl-ADP-ribose deacetylase (regulator of RNase III)
MIRETTGDILDADVEALVNPVNTVGVMGAGLALQFKRKYPDMLHQYVGTCRANEMCVGRVVVHYPGLGHRPWHIVLFPTKQDWRNPSQLEWIDAGLADLALMKIYDYITVNES